MKDRRALETVTPPTPSRHETSRRGAKGFFRSVELEFAAPGLPGIAQVLELVDKLDLGSSAL